MKKKILGVDVTDASEEDILEYVFAFLRETKKKVYIVTPNPEIIMYANSHKSFQLILNQARVALCDGVGLLWASRMLGKALRQRISGVDFMEKLCKESVREAAAVGFLGGRGSVAEKTAECLRDKYPGLQVIFVSEEWDEEGFETARKLYSSSEEFTTSREVSSRVASLPRTIRKEIDILFIAFGFPKQEEWMAEHLEKLPVRVMMGVGGAFDYFSGDVARAPKVLRTVGLEWLFRLIRQPWRVRRQTALLGFIVLVLKQRLGLRSLS